MKPLIWTRETAATAERARYIEEVDVSGSKKPIKESIQLLPINASIPKRRNLTETLEIWLSIFDIGAFAVDELNWVVLRRENEGAKGDLGCGKIVRVLVLGYRCPFRRPGYSGSALLSSWVFMPEIQGFMVVQPAPGENGLLVDHVTFDDYDWVKLSNTV